MLRLASESDHERSEHVVGAIHIEYVCGEGSKLLYLIFEHFSLDFHQ